jgi:hypothetical protein
MDVFECSKLQDALDLALVASIPSRKRKSASKASSAAGQTKTARSTMDSKTPGSMHELYLEEDVILDDEDDEFDDY